MGFDTNNKNIIITGGSQGLGLELAKLCVLNGCAKLTIVARTESKLKQSTSTLQSMAPGKVLVQYFVADLTLPESSQALIEFTGAPDILICAAGAADPGMILDQEPQALKAGMDINYLTCLYVSHAALRAMAQKQCPYERNILFISSVLAFYPLIGYGSYSPAKAAVRSLADTLRQETLIYNINVACAYPGNFLSEGYAKEMETKPAITIELEGSSPAISTAKCASIIFNKLKRGQQSITTDLIGFLTQGTMIGHGPAHYWFIQVFLSSLFCFIMLVVSATHRRKIKKELSK
ncbi:hypothetical protein CANCADRAFT_122487 [Tortispora caseinolytica NRRL Y-17796]|uniref:3-ketodihydrosphingosine reductase TSC10 n=1 Tax=Tortispora caseinolytica NRRL Y-17796 TaxID=767744 RepID=A0A1E4THQ5_9ASCO|nr:hypothetical protein CANCADRAFT_122487 [Tortispora caseinolytica NRRL Y-17796]